MALPNGQSAPVSNFRLRLSYWYVNHKLQLRRWLIILLTVLSVGLYGYAIVVGGIIIFRDDPLLRQHIANLAANTTNYSLYNQSHGPQPLSIASFDILNTADSRYDFVAAIKNPNPNFVARQVVFQLIAGGQVVAEKTGFIYPNEQKYISFFGVSGANLSNPVLKIDSIQWLRYNNWDAYATPRLNFTIANTKFLSAADSGIHGQLPVSVLTFTITNNTAFNYWHVGLNMVLVSTDKVGGANYLQLDQFKSGETRTVEMKWYDPLPPISDESIVPDIDILDPASYMAVN